ncbi:CoA-binding protein [Candidatus Daviesbacteria bacterium]|nr:CoA-binding protein [Candidatus Daviesbacteria bacterium]
MLLLPEGAKIIGQGITGSEGSTALPTMLDYGTKVMAGVTPRKGGQEILGLPVFNSVGEAKEVVGEIDGTVLYVPPLFVKGAAVEAIEAGVKFILIVTEKVPTKDESYIYALAKKNGISLVGPSSVGMICPSRKIKIGSIGGATPERAFIDGEVAIISKSGGMTSEIGIHLKNHGLGISWAVGIGGDRIIGTDFGDFLLALEDDPKTKASVIFGELGGTYEERVSILKKQGKIKKPVVAYIGGEFTERLPSDVQFGHAGAIIEGDRGKPDIKRQILKDAGVLVADDFDQIASLVKGAL